MENKIAILESRIEQLESEKRELVEVLREVATINEDDNSEVTHVAYKIKDLLIKHGVTL